MHPIIQKLPTLIIHILHKAFWRWKSVNTLSHI